jgi:osmotically-inducible protein OsmY
MISCHRILVGLVLATALSGPLLATVGPLPTTDRELVTSVEDALSRDRTLDRLQLDVQAENGIITLAGEVPNLNLHDEAIHLTASRRGVLEIRDNLTLDTGNTSDRTVKLRILAVLAQHRDFREPWLSLAIQDGVAAPRGQVGTIGRLLFLEQLVAGVSGVRQVDLGAVTVETELNRDVDDNDLHDAILALLRNPLVFPVSGRITVDVIDGEVTLSGVVPRLLDRMEAEFVAGLVGGVNLVENQLTIDPTHGRMRVRDFSATD